MADVLLIHGDTARSMDLFHSLPVQVADPFLYVELGDRRIAVVSPFDHATIRAADPQVELIDPEAYGRRALMAESGDFTAADLETAARAVADLGQHRAVVSWNFPVALADRLRERGLEVVVDHARFERRRRVKSPGELEGVRRAQAAADAAMGEAARLVRALPDGLTAEAVRAAMQAVCDERGAELGGDAIVAIGEQAAGGHESGTGPVLRGECVLIDIWPRDRASRCHADMTRTFVGGGEPPEPELAEDHALAREALRQVVERVRAGAHGRDLHDVSSAVFEAAGKPTLRTAEGTLAEGYNHGLGHGVGLEVHEGPGVGIAGEPLVAGDVIAVEPGCYRPGFGGVRLEDLLLVTDDGCEVLTNFPYEL